MKVKKKCPVCEGKMTVKEAYKLADPKTDRTICDKHLKEMQPYFMGWNK